MSTLTFQGGNSKYSSDGITTIFEVASTGATITDITFREDDVVEVEVLELLTPTQTKSVENAFEDKGFDVV